MTDYFCTPELRWVRRSNAAGVAMGDTPIVHREVVLQQRWRGSDGSMEWRDVPVVEEHARGAATEPQGG